MGELFYILREEGGVPEGPYSRAQLAAMAEQGADVMQWYVRGVTAADDAWVLWADMPAARPCPPTYMAWSMVSVFCCFPFSVVAVLRSSRVAELYHKGCYEEALSASRSALAWNIFFSISVVLLLVFCFFCFKYSWELWQNPTGDEAESLRCYFAD
ncbi:MAG: CD225/dispanin family protein [Akkermansia sp.]|nr:CD225/dispanin family protein [Akkermansia sp.]